MTSLIESSASSAMDFKAAMETAEKLSSLLCGYGEDGSINPQQSPLIALNDDLWKELYLLPTPPLSPECLNSRASSTTPVVAPNNGDSDDPDGSSLYVNMMEYDQMMDVLEEAERVLSDSQQSYQQDLLLQDCMWSGGGHYVDSLLSTAGNPASNIVPSITNTTGSATVGCTNGIGGEGNLCEPSDSQSLMLDENHSSNPEPEPDCVEPSAVFPVLRTSSDGVKCSSSKSSSSFRSSSAVCSLRSRASMSSSESEEEIDVVTVSERSVEHLSTSSSGKPIPMSGNTRHLSGSKKQLVGSSRHNAAVNTSIRKKRHTKRLARRASEDGMESDEEARRASHNVLERKRRNDLKNSFDILRGGIPELEENLRAPKVVILRKAVEYIHLLQTTDQKTKVDFTREQARNKKLTDRLSQLRSMSLI